VSVWYGILAPAGTPAAVISRLHTELVKALQTADIKERWAGLGAEILYNAPEEFAAFLKGDLRKWAKVVKDSGAKAD
jgi:tripartite-type tricarboxylate transporter receptor subunit TctC